MFDRITLEMSLKPFKKTDSAYIRQVCEGIFEQWKMLLKNRKCVNIMLFTADGSEILEYKGNLNEPFEWCKYIGGANPKGEYKWWDVNNEGLHSTNYLYTENPPEMTYGILKEIISTLKEVGKRMTGAEISVIETFDPGPEFAKSDFKYNRHNEICTGGAMGKGTFVCAYEKLHRDECSYAGFPDGIEEGTPFGTFFGRQCKHFLGDMGFDGIWFSNGLGFGRETWSTVGAVFDGEKFKGEEIAEVKKDVMGFWQLFRKECSLPIYTRGTNMSMGIDYATDGCPLGTIYNEVDDVMPPPNSPWAALDFDFGLELMGHMSRIAELPKDRYMFRFYLHDPWWANSPWVDRYQGYPHDIYLPMALSRIDENGIVKNPTDLNILTIDNSWGEMPDFCVNEAVPHIMKAERFAPDAPSPLVWVYPFDEYNNETNPEKINAMFSGDWFIRNAINCGLPLSTVISAGNFGKVEKDIFKDSVLISPVPESGSAYENAVLDYCGNGGKMIFYGNVNHASDRFKNHVGIKLTDGVGGELPLFIDGQNVGTVKHNKLTSGAEINTLCTNNSGFAEMGEKCVATHNMNTIWVACICSADYQEGCARLMQHDEKDYFRGEKILLAALKKLGFEISFEKGTEKSPVIMIHKHSGGDFYSVYSPSTTVKTILSHALGAPLLTNTETRIENGKATYHFAKAQFNECRIYVSEQEGIVGAQEFAPVSHVVKRRIKVSGLKNATVRFVPEINSQVEFCLNGMLDYWFVGDELCVEKKDGYYELRDVTGDLMISMK